jgi:thiamine biosynthesis lipoprotein
MPDDQPLVGRFTAMASPCEVLVDTADPALAARALAIARDEALRIEHKFSRYRDDNLIHRIQHAEGAPVDVDAETASLLDYAALLFEESDGRFDITSGVLRRAWTFDGREQAPDPALVRSLLERVGWQRAQWDGHALTLPAGMELDLGGIGKEYAVDRAAALVAASVPAAVLVNFGGDLFASGARAGGLPWAVGVDDPTRSGEAIVYRLEIERGGLATSGDARRFVKVGGRRLGHVLDPRTGWPVEGAPRAVTVLAETCLEAGSLATLALLRGPGARAWLAGQGARHWVFDETDVAAGAPEEPLSDTSP